MKSVFLSAYACEPNKGSEPEVGYRWLEYYLSQGWYVTLLTRANNKQSLNIIKTRYNSQLDIIYFDLFSFICRWKKKIGFTNLYYFLWQIFIFIPILKKCRQITFDRVHHVTFVSYRIFSCIIFVKGPLFIGPVAGLEKVPPQLFQYLSRLEQFREFIRSLINKFFLWSMYINPIYILAKHVVFTIDPIAENLPMFVKKKSSQSLGVWSSQPKPLKKLNSKKRDDVIIFVGNGLGIKGINLIWKIIQCSYTRPFIIYFYGNVSPKVQEDFRDHIDNGRVKFHGIVSRTKIEKIMREGSVLLAPFFRDSGGFVVLEALDVNMIPIVLNLGGPRHICDFIPEIIIDVDRKTSSELVEEMKNLIEKLLYDKQFCMHLRQKISINKNSHNVPFVLDTLFSAISAEES